MSRCSVLIVIGCLDIGGTEKHLAELLPLLQLSESISVSVYTVKHKGTLAESLEKRGVRVDQPPFLNVLKKLGRLGNLLLLGLSSLKLCWLLLRKRPSVVHFFLPTAYIIGGACALLMRCPIRVMSRRSLNVYQDKYPILRRAEEKLHRRMTSILGNSKAVLASLEQEGVSKDRTQIIYNGIEVDRFNHFSDRAENRLAQNIQTDVLVFVMIANLHEYKGHFDLLQALASVTDQLPESWLLLCVGRDEGMLSLLKDYADQQDLSSHIRWLGERQNVPFWLNLADIGLLCSHQEGFPNSVLEGMAAKLPMIATMVGGIPEAVVHKETGLLVPPKDPLALSEAILELALDPKKRKQYAESGHQRVQQYFSLSHCVEEYQSFYMSLFKERGLTRYCEE